MKPEEQLERLLDLAEGHARAVILGLHKPLMPSWLLISRDGAVDILGTPWRDELEKHASHIYMRRQMRKRNTVTYSFLTEAWMANVSREEVESNNILLPASKRPDRREVVIAFATDGTVTRWRCWDMIRDSNELVTALERSKTSLDEGKVETWMTGLLK